MYLVGAASKFYAYFREILMIKGKNPRGGGVTPMGIVGNQTHFVFESYVIGWVLQPDQVSSKSER